MFKKSIGLKVALMLALAAIVIIVLSGSPLTLPKRALSLLVPPAGQKILLIGQDTDSIDAYAAGIGIAPGGVTGYTSLNEQEGLTSFADNGAGRNNTSYLAGRYPESVIRESIWIVNQCQNIIDNTRWGAVKDYTKAMDKLIDTLLSFNRPVYMTWGYEFDGQWNKFEPECYKGAWMRMWDRLTQKNAHDKISMVWQSASWCGGTYKGYPISAWYPGDQYVDWVGLSYFTPQDCNSTKINEIVDFARAHNKPVMIAESSAQRYDLSDLTYSPNVDGTGKIQKTAEEIWNEWFVPYFNFIDSNSDVIKAADYINADWDSQRMWRCPPCRSGYWGDSRVQANATIKNLWTNTITSNGWLNASPTLFDTLGYPR
ncbi:MAG TPA: glycosyl hydrolase [Candidatus Paceibacterota bacterium]